MSMIIQQDTKRNRTSMFIDAQQDDLEPLDSGVVGLLFSSSSNGNDSFCSNRVGFAMAILL